MSKTIKNYRLTPEAQDLVERLAKHFTDPNTGRNTTRTEVIERAIRLLASREKVVVKQAKNL